jgi:hypothetical protein
MHHRCTGKRSWYITLHITGKRSEYEDTERMDKGLANEKKIKVKVKVQMHGQ